MSQYTQGELMTSAIGHGQRAWFMRPEDVQSMRDAQRYFDGPVPLHIARDIVCWQPITFDVDTLVDPNTMQAFTVPDRMRQVVAHPNGNVINIAGDGYNADLHIVMEEALHLATDNGLEVSSAVCLGDGDFLGMSFKPTDAVVLGAEFGGLEPYVSFNSSLTSKIATGFTTGTIRQVCDNTIQAAWGSAKTKMKLRRTRNSSSAVSAEGIREALDIALAVTADTIEVFDRWSNIEITDEELRKIFDKWSPLPEEEGRKRTLAEKRRNGVRRMIHDRRNMDMGQTAAGIWQAHNTWAHWEVSARGLGKDDRIGRRMMRTATDEVGKHDEAFMAIVASIKPEVSQSLQTV